MSERAAEKGELEAKNTALESEVSRLSGEVKVAAQNARASSGQVTSEELARRLGDERAAIHAEYEQERIAYQKLLKEYNTLEAANDDLKERVNMLRGGEISP